MITSSNKIRISFVESGTTLKRRGTYTEAILSINKKNNTEELLKPSQTITEPIYQNSRGSTTLGAPFITYWLNRMNWKPTEKLKNNKDRIMFSVYKDWKQLSEEQVLIAAAKLYLHDRDMDYNLADITIL